MVYGCILACQSVIYHFGVIVTMTSDLVFRIIVSEAYLVLFGVGIFNLVCGAECHILFLGHCDLDLVFRIIVSRAFLLYYLR